MKIITRVVLLAIGLQILQLSLLSAQSCTGFKTFTQGGWGASPSGNNVGTFLNNNFAAAFPAPTYLTIGCTNKLQLTSATAVRNFLPNGTTPYLLPAGTKVNPTRSNFSNVFAGQLVALALNLRFDNTIPSFAPSATNLKDLIIASGPFRGKTVQFLFDNANLRIGSCAGAFSATLSEYTTAIDNVNRNYDNGTVSGSFLVCPLTLTCITTNALCFNSSTGSMTAVPGGGLSPYTYVWSGSVAGNVQTAANLPAGTYTVTVTDAAGSTRSTTCTVGQPTVLTASSTPTSPLCNGGSGTVTVSASGGTPPYTGTGDFTHSAGTYTFIVTDANGCTASTASTITEPAAITVSLTLNAARVCSGSGCDASASVEASGGTAPYTYLWSNGSTDDQVTGLCSGTSIAVRVTDANGCFADADPSITTCDDACDTLTTFTQGGWGAEPNGNNPGTYLHANFDAAFPDGLTIGCDNTLTLTTAQSVTDWLPSGTTPSVLPAGDLIDDLTYDNVLAAQLVAATLNVGFDTYDATFDGSTDILSDRFLTMSPFEGMTVAELLAAANEVIGGCSTDYSLTDLNIALTAVNENYDNGSVDQGDLSCSSTAAPSARRSTARTGIESVFPNPAHDRFTVTLEGQVEEHVQFHFTDLLGRSMDASFQTVQIDSSRYQVEMTPVNSQVIIMRIITSSKTMTRSIVIQ